MMNGNILVHMDHVNKMVGIIQICMLVCDCMFYINFLVCIHFEYVAQEETLWTYFCHIFLVSLLCLPLALKTKMELMTMSACDAGISLLTSPIPHLHFISGRATGWGPI